MRVWSIHTYKSGDSLLLKSLFLFSFLRTLLRLNIWGNLNFSPCIEVLIEKSYIFPISITFLLSLYPKILIINILLLLRFLLITFRILFYFTYKIVCFLKQDCIHKSLHDFLWVNSCRTPSKWQITQCHNHNQNTKSYKWFSYKSWTKYINHIQTIFLKQTKIVP